MHVRDAEISRLTRELVELRLLKARAPQRDEDEPQVRPGAEGALWSWFCPVFFVFFCVWMCAYTYICVQFCESEVNVDEHRKCLTFCQLRSLLIHMHC